MGRELREKWDKVQGRDSRVVNDQNDKLHVLGRASWGKSPPPQGESPKCYSRLDMNLGNVSS